MAKYKSVRKKLVNGAALSYNGNPITKQDTSSPYTESSSMMADSPDFFNGDKATNPYNQTSTGQYVAGAAALANGANNMSNVYGNSNSTNRQKADSFDKTARDTTMAINPVIGTAIGIGDMIGKPIRNNLEKTDPVTGKVKNRQAVKAGAVAGMFFDPGKWVGAISNGSLDDPSGNQYVNDIETNAQNQIAQDRLNNQQMRMGGKMKYDFGGNINGEPVNGERTVKRNKASDGVPKNVVKQITNPDGSVEYKDTFKGWFLKHMPRIVDSEPDESDSLRSTFPAREMIMRNGGKMSYEDGGLVEFKGYKHEQGGIPLGANSEVEDKENAYYTQDDKGEKRTIVNSTTWRLNNHLFKGMAQAGIPLDKRFIGKTPADMARMDKKRYSRDAKYDMFTKNSVDHENKGGRGAKAIENMSTLVGQMTQPQDEAEMMHNPQEENAEMYARMGGKMYAKGGKLPDYNSDFSMTDYGNNNEDYSTFDPYGNIGESISRSVENRDRNRALINPLKQTELDNLANIEKSKYPETMGDIKPLGNYDPTLNERLERYSKDPEESIDDIIARQKKTEPYKSYDPAMQDDLPVGPYDYSAVMKENNQNKSFDPNSLYNAGNFLGGAYDIYRGLKGGDKVNYERVIPEMVNYQASRDLNRRDIKEGVRAGYKSSVTGNQGQDIATRMQLAAAGQKSISDSNAKSFENEFNTNVGFKNSSRYANAQIQRAEADARQQEKDLAKNTLQSGLTQFGQGLAQTGSDKNFTAQDDKAIKAISGKYRDWEYDKKRGDWKNKYSNKRSSTEDLIG